MYIFFPLHYYCNVHTDYFYKGTNASTFIYHATAICMPTTSINLKWYICQNMKISSCTDMRQCVSVNTSYEFDAINIVTRYTSIDTFHILGICPRTNTPANAHFCPTACLLNATYRPKITAHISKINNKKQIYSTMLLPYMCQQWICPWNATYKLYA